ncbi:NADH dehydrogenase subunit I [Aeropyrum camini SY1 = JCM 12091]|uniref:NADH dehydrogenase subunit I n=2 Tax=Aeropyrum camini TaxID=229980 RepID=U3TA02_9CREN|nr:NADH dehydrogenase subunit I [Aeropyrum camini SY1 = JCM 12091]
MSIMPPKAVAKTLPRRGGLFAGVADNLAALMIGLKYFVNPRRFSIYYPREYPELRQGYRGFIILNKAKCISCAACARICPSAAMKMIRVPVPHPKEPEKTVTKQFPVINYQRCIFCGYCVDICPTEALYHVNYHDIVYDNLAEMFWDLETFQKEPEYRTALEGTPIRLVIHEEYGLVKIPVRGAEENGG